MTTLVRIDTPDTAPMFRPLRGRVSGPDDGEDTRWAVEWWSQRALCPSRQEPPPGLRVVGVAQCDDGLWWVVEP